MNGIRYFRKKNHMTQSELAKVLGVTQTSVSQWEGGRNYPDIKTAKRLATMFGATLDQILGMEDMSESLTASRVPLRISAALSHGLEDALFPLEQKTRLLSIMNRLSPLARQRVLDRAEIYLEIETQEAKEGPAAELDFYGT